MLSKVIIDCIIQKKCYLCIYQSFKSKRYEQVDILFRLYGTIVVSMFAILYEERNSSVLPTTSC